MLIHEVGSKVRGDSYTVGLNKVLCQTSIHPVILQWINELLSCKHTEQAVIAIPNLISYLCSAAKEFQERTV